MLKAKEKALFQCWHTRERSLFKFLTFALFFLALTSHSRAGFFDEMPKKPLSSALGIDYQPVLNLSLRVLKQYPSSQYYYIGLGRSPTVVIAMTQAILGPLSARNLPLADMRFMQPADLAEVAKIPLS